MAWLQSHLWIVPAAATIPLLMLLMALVEGALFTWREFFIFATSWTVVGCAFSAIVMFAF